MPPAYRRYLAELCVAADGPEAWRYVEKRVQSAFCLITRARTILAARGWGCGLPRQGSGVGP